MRVFATGLAVLLLLGTLAGGAWALVIANNKKVNVAATYTVTLTPTQTQADEGGASWRVGQATISESCSADYDPVSGHIRITQIGRITNHGPGPIGIVSASGIEWLEEGQTTGGGGETVNEENYPGPVGGLQIIGILKEGGPSAIGSQATSARVNPDAGTAICVLSLHVQG
ncbi:MAG: hypothetical protein WD402_01875 [Chloroflexota bacterium]